LAIISVVDLHRFDADPDPDLTFHHFDAGPDTNPDPTLSSTHVGKSEIFIYFSFLFTAMLVYIVLSFSPMSQISSFSIYKTI
jgi:hypothetical protein